MNKILLLLLVLSVPQVFAEDLESSSEVVDPDVSLESLDTIAIPEENPAPAVVEPEPTVATPAEPIATDPVDAAEKPAATEVSESVSEDDNDDFTDKGESQENPPATIADKVVDPDPEPSVTEMKPVAHPLETPSPMITTDIRRIGEGFQPRKSHWVTTFGFEAMEYQVPLDYNGTHEQFKDETRSYYGGRLGFGREFYLGWGFLTTTKIEGYYMGTLFEKAYSADPEVNNLEFSYIKKTGYLYGGDVSQSFGWMFDMATKNPFLDEMTYLTVEPFISAGIGIGRAYNRTSFHYDTTDDEDYRQTTKDEMTTASLGVGFNVTSVTGFFLYLKATQYRLNITKRRDEAFSQTVAQPGGIASDSTLTDGVNPDPVTVYALGGGYKF